MLTTFVLKCILLAKTEVLILEEPVNEWGMATISKDHHGAHFEATIVEERMNSVAISFPKYGASTMSYSTRDYDMRALSTKLDVKKEHASLDCEINVKN